MGSEAIGGWGDGFRIADTLVLPGERKTASLRVASLYTSAPVDLPVIVLRGHEPGPTMFVSAALHGDEIIGVEIIRRVLRLQQLGELRGTLLAVPIVNTLAFIHQSRYLPDRRDLNRSFPGSQGGSLAARLANLFVTEVVGRSDFGVDLHTGAIHRPNLPQIRTDLRNATNQRLAKAFGAPLFLDSRPAAGTLREYTTRQNIPVILYESGEALRFDETAIRIGAQGVQNVMWEMGLLPRPEFSPLRVPEPILAHSSHWIRAPSSGILRTGVGLGDHIRRGQSMGVIGDPFGENEIEVCANLEGVVIGRLNLPLVHEGDALFHLGTFDAPAEAAQAVEQMEAEMRTWSGEEPPIV
ncbi:succinylglutamate desuccinylase/aspartoacylase family protein [Panacagrimonas sp.]|uniref:succinylglutamate desuccinylase/aspartoacylase family protein n=1 Tax=Panacagrimonas sp. TaxID=2480088 RepID=UPI003B52E5FB